MKGIVPKMMAILGKHQAVGAVSGPSGEIKKEVLTLHWAVNLLLRAMLLGLPSRQISFLPPGIATFMNCIYWKPAFILLRKTIEFFEH